MKLGVGKRPADFISPHSSMKAYKARKIRHFSKLPFYIISYISIKFNAETVYGLCRN